MTDLSVVDEAATWADLLVRREHRGPGDTIDAARQRAARKHKLPEQVLWSLRYRKPKRIWADLYKRLEMAVAAEIQSQESRLAHEIAITKAIATSASSRALVDEAEALLGTAKGSKARATAERTQPQTDRA
ncbi:hypothetical protein [Devosia alba]|uniref:hypothetical protein n=1 Tax=Devosia alba TaxID=3152360 RepID=UPI003266B42B